MKKITLIAALLLCSFLSAQQVPTIEWQKTLGSTFSDEGYSITSTPDGGYIALGFTSSATGDVGTNHGHGDYWIAKLDAAGNLQWQKNYGGSGNDIGGIFTSINYKIKAIPTGGYIIGGTSPSNDHDVTGNNGSLDVWLLKIDETGNIVWQKNYGGAGDEDFKDLQITADGGLIFTAQTSSSDSFVETQYIPLGSFTEAWVVKLDASGNVQWQKSFGGFDSFLTEFTSIEQTSDGGYIATGVSDGVGGDVAPAHENLDFWIVKMDPTGNNTWSKSYGGNNQDIPHSIKQTTDGGYIVAGEVASTDGDVTGNHGDLDVWIIKLDNLGVLQWQKTYGGTQAELASNIQLNGNLGYVLGGTTRSIDGDFPANTFNNINKSDELVFKIDLDGNIIWSKTMGGSNNETLLGLELTPDGGFITIGITSSNDEHVSGNNGIDDYWVVKLSPDCSAPEITTETAITICTGESLTLTANVTADAVSWYDTANGQTPIFIGASFQLPEPVTNATYWVEAINYTCTSDRTEITITVNPISPTPTATAVQHFEAGATLANLVVNHTGTLTWYANEALTESLPETTLLTAGTTYYATQTLAGSCQSAAIPVLAELSLATIGFNNTYFSFYPNPVQHLLHLEAVVSIEMVKVYDVTGRIIKSERFNSKKVAVAFDDIANGTYYLEVKSGNEYKVIKVIKNE